MTKDEKENQTRQDNPEQSQRFVETAKELDADTTNNSFERAMDKLVPKEKAKER